ncbi:barstar family protein [Streptomyces acidicola]|uniref:barstar family protein n=1 Tax=Streptomyces acidicola TaxID=2596892 RepID=UPI002AD55DA3|nr:barstar family protein [Streptomyces acidicola]
MRTNQPFTQRWWSGAEVRDTGADRPAYVLLSYDQEAEFNCEEDYEETWALCADAEGLFADPRPPERGTYELLGCAPEGDLEAAVTRARAEGSAPLGFLVLEILDAKGERVHEWYLEDVRVLGEGPCARDLSLRDITVEGAESAANASGYPQRPSLSPGFRLLGAEGERRGTCKDLAHIREERPDPLEPPVRLLGCSPRGALLHALNSGEEDLGHAKLLRLDAHGRTIQSAVEGELMAWIPSARGRGLVDLTLEPWSERPPTAAEEVWEIWDRGRPTEPNLWAARSSEGREFWLGTALAHHDQDRPDEPSGGTYHLDGRHVTDEPGFLCAMGEAVNGPGGYFGRNYAALNDCLAGRWGAARPFTLVWHHAHVARACLGVTPRADYRPLTFEEVLALFAKKRIDVHFA